MFKKSLLFMFVITMASVVYGQQPLSLNECIRLALQHNAQVLNSQLDVQSSAYQVKEAKSALLPTVDLTGQYLYYMQVPEQYAPASAFGGPEGEYARLSLSLPQSTSANLQVTQTIYNQAVWNGLKTAKVSEEASRRRETLTREEVLYNVTATYFTIQILNDNLQRLQQNISNLEKTATINETLKDNEIVAANTHNRLLINLENLRNQYENERITRDKHVTTLKYLLNDSGPESISVEPFDEAQLMTVRSEVDINARPDIQLQKSQVELARFDKRHVAAGYFPTLTSVMTNGYAGYNNDFSPGKALNNDWINSSSYALTLRFNVFDGFQKHNKLKQREVAIQKNINTLSSMKVNAEREVEDAFNKYEASATQLQQGRHSLDLAQQLFNSAQQEFENGLTSTTELLNAQNDLSSALSNYSNALLNVKLAELQVKKASGTLLGDYTF